MAQDLKPKPTKGPLRKTRARPAAQDLKPTRKRLSEEDPGKKTCGPRPTRKRLSEKDPGKKTCNPRPKSPY